MQSLATLSPQTQLAIERGRELPPFPAKSCDQPLKIYFDDILISPSNGMQLPVDYRPDLLAIYLGDDLALVIFQGQLVFNRLPETYLREWQIYG